MGIIYLVISKGFQILFQLNLREFRLVRKVLYHPTSVQLHMMAGEESVTNVEWQLAHCEAGLCLQRLII